MQPNFLAGMAESAVGVSLATPFLSTITPAPVIDEEWVASAKLLVEGEDNPNKSEMPKLSQAEIEALFNKESPLFTSR